MKKIAATMLAALLMLSSCALTRTASFAIGNTGLSLLVSESFIPDDPENEILFMAADEAHMNAVMVHVDHNGYTVGMLDELSSNLDSDELSALAQSFLHRALDGDAACYTGSHAFELYGRSVFCEMEQAYDPDVQGVPVISLTIALFLQDGETSYWVTCVESLTGDDAVIRLNEMQAAEDLIAFLDASAEDLARRIITESADTDHAPGRASR